MEVFVLFYETYNNGDSECGVIGVYYTRETLIQKLDKNLKEDTENSFKYEEEHYRQFINYINETNGEYASNRSFLYCYYEELDNYDDYVVYYAKKLNIEF